MKKSLNNRPLRKQIIKPVEQSRRESAESQPWFSVHSHSRYSKLDGMSFVERMVEAAARHGQPGHGLTDHGSMGGVIQHYKACRKHGVVPFPGFEGYLLDPEADLETKKADRFHFGLLALDFTGYQALIRAMSVSHTRPRFSRFPRLTMEDLAALGKEAGDHLALTTGCFFGLPQQQIATTGDIGKAQATVRQYASWFSNTYVEVQNHNIVHDEETGFNDAMMVSEMIRIADRLGLPVVVTQDSHYVEESEKSAHALMKRMTYGGADDEFPGDAFHMAHGDWVRDHYTSQQWTRSNEGLHDLLSKNQMTMPAVDEYKTHVPSMGFNDPIAKLRRICLKALRERKLLRGKLKSYYIDRLYYELDVIEKVGMADYFLLVLEFCQWLTAQESYYEARGSANGSLVAFLIGVTQSDPVYWDERFNTLGMTTTFDRFLAEDRIGAPDIDIDVESAIRDDAVAWLNGRFAGATRIGTWAQMGLRDDDGQGSVIITYKAYLARLAKETNKPFKYGWIQSIDDVEKINERDAAVLRVLDNMRDSTGTRSVLKSYGQHASGVLLSGDNLKIEEYVPTMLVASSNTTVTQLDQDDVEALGLTKVDVLGQQSLTVMKQCQRLMGRKDPTDFTWIPQDDEKAARWLHEGRKDTGIFHIEGYTKALGGKEMDAQTTVDSILMMALYMPGCMDIAEGMQISQKDLYVQRRRLDAEGMDTGVTYLHPIFERVLSSTHGAVVFQEQVLAIIRGLGMSKLGVNKFLKALKDSGKGSSERNAQRMREVRQEFDGACIANDLKPDEVWRQTASFVSYGFNRAHATGYGIRAYRCAYLKAHYPAEFMTALLQVWAGKEKEPLYVREAKKIKLKVRPPDINTSGATWALDRTGGSPMLRKGFESIPHVGRVAAQELERHQPYGNVQDIIDRCNGQSVTGGKAFTGRNYSALNGVLGHLRDHGVLDSITY